MSEMIDIAGLKEITYNNDLKNVSPSYYSSYSVFVEDRDATDTPSETQYSLYRLFQAGINKIKETNSIIIGEKILSHTQILLTNNYNKILEEFGKPDNETEIDYDGINAILNDLHENDDAYTVIWGWLSKFANFYVNPNPEEADSSNLILTQSIKNQIQIVTESILNKIFRNLIHLIRVKHDYRLYGVGATVFGGKATELSSEQKMSKFSALPPSCWRQFTGNYIVGKSAYGEDISQISATIKNTKYHISPHTMFGIASHTHTVITARGNVPTTIKKEHGVLTKIDVTENVEPSLVQCSKNTAVLWSDAMIKIAGCEPDGRYTNGKGEKTSIDGSYEWSYSWNSKNGKLKSSDTWSGDIYKHYDTILPTYSTYVWQWINEDTETTISSPNTYITEAN